MKRLPQEVVHCCSLEALVLISNSLVELPQDWSALTNLTQLFLNGNFIRIVPPGVGQLPILQEFCIDANLVESLPDFRSPNLVLLSAPANQLKAVPRVAPCIERVEVHGNSICRISIPSRTPWDKLITLKLMGNNLASLPEAIGGMRLGHMLDARHARKRRDDHG